MIGLALVALFALGAFMASTAMALEEGFLPHEAFALETENGVKPTFENESKKSRAEPAAKSKGLYPEHVRR